MDGLSRAAGSPMPFKIKEKTYLLRPLKLKDIGTIESHLLGQRKSFVEVTKEAIVGLPPEMQMNLMREAIEKDTQTPNHITATEFAHFIDTREGVVMTLWLMLRQEHPEVTREDVAEIVELLSEEQFQHLMEVRNRASQMDEMGNEIGPQTTTMTTSQDDAGQESSPGESSSDSSPKPTPA